MSGNQVVDRLRRSVSQVNGYNGNVRPYKRVKYEGRLNGGMQSSYGQSSFSFPNKPSSQLNSGTYYDKNTSRKSEMLDTFTKTPNKKPRSGAPFTANPSVITNHVVRAWRNGEDKFLQKGDITFNYDYKDTDNKSYDQIMNLQLVTQVLREQSIDAIGDTITFSKKRINYVMGKSTISSSNTKLGKFKEKFRKFVGQGIYPIVDINQLIKKTQLLDPKTNINIKSKYESNFDYFTKLEDKHEKYIAEERASEFDDDDDNELFKLWTQSLSYAHQIAIEAYKDDRSKKMLDLLNVLDYYHTEVYSFLTPVTAKRKFKYMGILNSRETDGYGNYTDAFNRDTSVGGEYDSGAFNTEVTIVRSGKSMMTNIIGPDLKVGDKIYMTMTMEKDKIGRSYIKPIFSVSGSTKDALNAFENYTIPYVDPITKEFKIKTIDPSVHSQYLGFVQNLTSQVMPTARADDYDIAKGYGNDLEAAYRVRPKTAPVMFQV